jgi:hypothetical protein
MGRLKRLLCLVFFFGGFNHLKASHLLGGELSYKCLGNGLYEFEVVLYRDCSGISWNQLSVTVSNSHGLPDVLCNRLPATMGVRDLTPRCPGETMFSCGFQPTLGSGPAGSIAAQVYRGTLDMSAVAPPPATGYVFYVNNVAVNVRNANLNMGGGTSFAMRTIMHRYIDPQTGLPVSPAQLCDNSAAFAEPPVNAFVLNPTDTSRLFHYAYDEDLDSIAYHIDFPWTSFNSPLFFTGAFSLNNPWAGVLPFATATGLSAIHPVSGIIQFKAQQAGNVLSCVRVDSWRCGQLLSSVYRDFQLTIVSSLGGAPPFVPGASTSFQQRAPQFTEVYQRGPTAYELSVYADDTLILPVEVVDNFPLFRGTISNPVLQPDSVYLLFEGRPISSSNSETSGCASPPCMTIRSLADPNPPAPVGIPPVPISVPVSNSPFDTTTRYLGRGYRGIQSVGAKLVWIPGCDNFTSDIHGNCGTQVNHNQIAITALDNHCPSVGKNQLVYNIRVLALPVLPAPKFQGVSVDADNRATELSFFLDYDLNAIDPIDTLNILGYNAATDSLLAKARSEQRRRKSFHSYRFYRAINPHGPFLLIDSVENLEVNTWRDTAVEAGQFDYFYYITTVSSCGRVESAPSDTLKTIRVQAFKNLNAGVAQLQWDSMAVVHGRPHFQNATGKYYIEREVVTLAPGSWQRIDSVIQLQQYTHASLLPNDSVSYRVGLLDFSGMVYYSAVSGLRVANVTSIPEAISGTIKLFPNPAANAFKIRAEEVVFSVMIYDLQGRLLQVVKNGSESNEIEIKVSLPVGAYVVSVQTQQGLYHKRLMIH